MEMNESLRVLRRVGWLLIAIGVIDIGIMIYCFINEMDYSSSLNIFAAIAGIFLVRGYLGAARIVTWFSAFMFSALLLSLLIVVPWIQPLDYWMWILRTHLLSAAVYTAFLIAFFVVMFWIYRQLRLPAVVEARAAAG